MKNLIVVAIAIALTTAFTDCVEQKIDVASEGERLMKLSREWAQVAQTDSIEKTLRYWADDAVVMPPGQSAVKGKKAIREMVEGSSKIPGFRITWEPLSVHVAKSGDLAYMIERNEVTMNDKSGKLMTEYNKVVTVWRKEADGSWKNVIDMWNADPSQKK